MDIPKRPLLAGKLARTVNEREKTLFSKVRTWLSNPLIGTKNQLNNPLSL